MATTPGERASEESSPKYRRRQQEYEASYWAQRRAAKDGRFMALLRERLDRFEQGGPSDR